MFRMVCIYSRYIYMLHVYILFRLMCFMFVHLSIFGVLAHPGVLPQCLLEWVPGGHVTSGLHLRRIAIALFKVRALGPLEVTTWHRKHRWEPQRVLIIYNVVVAVWHEHRRIAEMGQSQFLVLIQLGCQAKFCRIFGSGSVSSFDWAAHRYVWAWSWATSALLLLRLHWLVVSG